MKILKQIIFPLLLIVVSLHTVSCSVDNSNSERPRAVKGVLDCRSWDFSREEPLPLNGTWELYWAHLLSPSDFCTSSGNTFPGRTFFTMPSVWNGHVIDGKELSGQGYGTFRLVVKLKKGTTRLAVKMPYLFTAYRLWINNEIVCENGVVGRNRNEMKPQYHPVEKEFAVSGEEVEIILQISNFYHYKGGMRAPVYLGASGKITLMRHRGLILDALIIGCLLIMGFYHIAVFILRRAEYSLLMFSLICFIFAIRTSLVGNAFIVELIPSLNWFVAVKVEFFSIMMLPGLFMVFFHLIFPENLPGIIVKVIMILSIISSVIIVLADTVMATEIFFRMIIFLGIAVFLSISASIIAAVKKRQDGAIVLFAGFWISVLAMLNDIMYTLEVVNTGFYYSIGMLPVLMSQSLVMALRISNTEKQIETMTLKLLSLDRLKDEFLTNTSHELKTPLNGIIGIAQSLMEGAAGSVSVKVKDNLAMIAASGNRLLRLVQGLILFTRLKNSDVVLHREMVNVHSLAELTIQVMAHQNKKKGIQIQNRVPALLDPIYTDGEKLQQVLFNLVDNSLKFTDSGFIEISAEKKSLEGDEYLYLSVTDTGIGIMQEFQETIFNSFEQGDGSVSRRYGGMGIGLSIANQLVTMQGGTISVISDEGKGSRFIVTLPYGNDRIPQGNYIDSEGTGFPVTFEQELDGESFGQVDPHYGDSIEYTAGSEISPGKILVVDDDMINIQVVKNYLTIDNYAVLSALDGDEALACVAAEKPDIVILDIMMPGMSGYDVCSEIRKNFSLLELPVIFFSVQDRVSDIVAGFTAGANDFLSKPVNRDILLSRVATLLKMKQSIQSYNEARYTLLQERMNPHFLFNALTTIHVLVENNPELAKKSIITLSEIYRYIQDSISSNLVPFVDEWNFVKSYIDFERISYPDIIDYSITNDANVRNIKIPPLTIQPFVGNAVKHGLKNRTVKGMVTITAAKSDGIITVVIEDNGMGFRADDLYSRSIGNIRKRLIHYYPESSITLENSEEGGARVVICIPSE